MNEADKNHTHHQSTCLCLGGRPLTLTSRCRSEMRLWHASGGLDTRESEREYESQCGEDD